MEYWNRNTWENASVLSEPVECDVPYLERLFLKGNFDVCLAKLEGYLNEIKRKSCPRQWTKAAPTFTNETDRLIILAIQCYYEMREPVKRTRSLLTKTYGEQRYWPPKIFLVWLQLLIKKGLLDEGYSSTIKYLRCHVRIPPKVEYKQLVELLVFHCLVPLGKKKQAKTFLTVNHTLERKVKNAFLNALEKAIEPSRKKTMPVRRELPTILEKLPSNSVKVKLNPVHETRTRKSLLSLLYRFLLHKDVRKAILTSIAFFCIAWTYRVLKQRLSKVNKLTVYASLFGLRKS